LLSTKPIQIPQAVIGKLKRTPVTETAIKNNLTNFSNAIDRQHQLHVDG